MLQWYYLALISSVLMGLATILEKRTLKAEHASAYSASLALLTAAVGLVFLPFFGFSMSLQSWIFTYIISFLLTIAYLLTARTFKHGTLSATSPLNAVLPILFTVVFAFILLGEQLSIIQYIGIGITIIATYMILFEKSRKEDFGSNKYIYFIILSAVLTGLAGILFKYVLFSTNALLFVVVLQIFMAINMVFYMNFRYGGIKETLSNANIYKKELAAIVLLTVGYRMTYYVAVAMAPVSIVTPLRSTILVIMTVFSGSIMFKESRMRNKILLAVLILLGAYLMII